MTMDGRSEFGGEGPGIVEMHIPHVLCGPEFDEKGLLGGVSLAQRPVCLSQRTKSLLSI